MADHGKRTPRRLLRMEGVTTAVCKAPPRFLRVQDRRMGGLGFRPKRMMSPGEVTTPLVWGHKSHVSKARTQSITPRADELVSLFRLLRLSSECPPRTQQKALTQRFPEVHLLRSLTTPRHLAR